jgi:hypothetical protein
VSSDCWCAVAGRNLRSSLLTVNLGSPIRPRKPKASDFASRLIEPLWAEFSFAAWAEVCDLEYVCL